MGTQSSGIDKLKELVGDAQEFQRLIEQLTDREIWGFACVAAVSAGGRAQAIGRDDVENVCAEFVRAMHRLVGTPNLQELTIQ